MAIITDSRPKTQNTLEGVAMTIDTQSRFVYEQYIKIYENKYSFLREVTANAFDAVIELWERDFMNTYSKEDFLAENPIVLGVYADASGHYISIQETKGIGMSPERMQEYLKITNSTKRESEHQIGAKGIGRLSALAYQDEYYIETVYDGVKYFYMVDFYDNAPKITATHDMPTNDSNHTKVKVYLKDFKKEKKDIEDYVNKNLCFFENLVVEQLDFKCLLNDYEDYQNYSPHKHKGSFSKAYTNGYNYQEKIILLGSIPYIIDIFHFKLPSYIDINIKYQDFIIKFNVSDLDVVASRDTLSMTDRTFNTIKERLIKIEAEVRTLQNIIFEKLWNSSPQDDNSFKSLNRFFADGKLVLENVRIDSDVTKLSIFTNDNGDELDFNHWFSNQEYQFNKFNGSGNKPYLTERIFNGHEGLISDSNLLVKHRKNRFIIFEDQTEKDLTELKKFIKYKSSEEFLEEDKQARLLNKSFSTATEKNNIYCYLYHGETYAQVINDSTTFDEIIAKNSDKQVYHLLYNRDNKSDAMYYAANVLKINDNCIIALTTENNRNRMKNIPHVNTIPLNINKIADSYLISLITAKHICVSNDPINFDKVIKEVLDKYNWKKLTDGTSYFNNIMKLHYDIHNDENLQFSIEFGKDDYNPELYKAFCNACINIENMGNEYYILFYSLANDILSNVSASYVNYHNYCVHNIDGIKLHAKILSLYPQSKEERSFDFDKVIINKLNNN